MEIQSTTKAGARTQIEIKNETETHAVSEYRAQQIRGCKTRDEVAAILRSAGYQVHIGGRHVAAIFGGIRRAIITSPTLPDFN